AVASSHFLGRRRARCAHFGVLFFFSSRRRHTRWPRDWSSDVCSSDLYRYHDLFREALRARLHASQPELVPLLHQRVARWYETQGEWREAIAHALAAPDYPLAASLMEQAAPHFWLSGEARTVPTWVLALPDPVLGAHTRLALDAALRFLNSVHLSTETVH